MHFILSADERTGKGTNISLLNGIHITWKKWRKIDHTILCDMVRVRQSAFIICRLARSPFLRTGPFLPGSQLQLLGWRGSVSLAIPLRVRGTVRWSGRCPLRNPRSSMVTTSLLIMKIPSPTGQGDQTMAALPRCHLWKMQMYCLSHSGSLFTLWWFQTLLNNCRCLC